jgi:RimJ/RimL family protein N-acetyltransferase
MLKYRKPLLNDILIYFNWANDPAVRDQSFDSNTIDFETHEKWFKEALKDTKCFMYLFQNEENDYVGQVRIQIQNGNNAIIGISIDAQYRGKRYSREMIEKACDSFFGINRDCSVSAFIKVGNLGSKSAFLKAGFEYTATTEINNYKSLHFTKKSHAN